MNERFERRVRKVLNMSAKELEGRVEQRKVKTADIKIGRCNLDCNQCFMGKKENSKIDIDRLERKYNELKSQGYSAFIYPLEITMEAGEPYYNKLLDLCNDQWKGRLLTNGTIIGKDRKVLRSLTKAADKLSIGNFEGLGEDAQEALTGYRNLKDTVKGIRAAKEEGFDVGIFSVVSRANLGQIRGMCERAYELGAESIKFYRLLPVGNAKKRIRELVPDAKECEDFIRNVFDIRKSFSEGRKLRISLANSFGPDLYSKTTLENLADPNYFTKYICFAANPEYVAVELDGDKETTYPCFFLMGEENLVNKKLDFDPSKLKGMCGECDYKRLCGGGCRAAAYARKGDFYDGMDFCQTKTIEKFDLRR